MFKRRKKKPKKEPAKHHPMKHTTADVNIVIDQSPWYVRLFQWCINIVLRRK